MPLLSDALISLALALIENSDRIASGPLFFLSRILHIQPFP